MGKIYNDCGRHFDCFVQRKELFEKEEKMKHKKKRKHKKDCNGRCCMPNKNTHNKSCHCKKCIIKKENRKKAIFKFQRGKNKISTGRR